MELTKEVFKKEYEGRVLSITDFRRTHSITYQAVQYAMAHDKIDFVKLSNKVRLVVLTQKTLDYTPNSSPSRAEIA